MILLVVGLVAVIVVILIAVFLSIRLGHGDEHDDELDMRPSSRDQRAGEDRWREPSIRDTGRPARTPGGERPGGADDHRRRGAEPGYGARTGPRDRDRPDRNYDAAPHRPARREQPDYADEPARRRSSAAASAQDRGRYDAGRSRGTADDDYPDEYADEGYPGAGDRSGSGRKAAAAAAPGKSRSRQHKSKRDDDDDWPSGEWESLSDEQYWAELSADKPLATTARPASQPARAAKPAPAERGTRAPRTGAAPGLDSPAEPPRAEPRAVGRPGRSPELAPPRREEGREPRPRRERPAEREAVTERLPVRHREPSVPVARQAAEAPPPSRPVPAGTHPSLDTGMYPARDTGRHPSLDALPAARDTGPHATGGYPPRDAGRHPSLDTGPRPARDPSLVMHGGPSSSPPPRVPGALDDDPLTSPSFSMVADPATDSRSYGHSRKSSRSADNGSGQRASDPLSAGPGPATPPHGNGAAHPGGHDSGGHATADYPSPGYAYPAEQVPAPAPPARWYGSPPPAEPAATPAYGDPYSYPAASASSVGSPASLDGNASYGGYLADPLRVYSPPPYESPAASYPDPASVPYQAPPAYPEAYPEHPYPPGPSQPEPAPYPDGYTGPGYAPGYENGYGTDPYAGGGYGAYPPQG